MHVVHIVIVISTGLPVPFLIIRIYWVAPRLLTRDSLSTYLHNDSLSEAKYQDDSSAKILHHIINPWNKYIESWHNHINFGFLIMKVGTIDI